ncbi:MAG TPA: hypothetical protein VIG08_05320 [Gemmatimonadales bacterium]|jgi:hypothetical protein
MGSPEPGGSTPPDAGRSERPLGRGLEDVSHVFLSPKSEAEGPPPTTERRPPPRDRAGPGALLLRPATAVTREQIAATLREFEGGIEAGLRAIDARIPCEPSGEIDLLAIDRASQLTIIDFDTTGSDDLLIRGLGHYDWATRNVPNLRRMLRGQPVNFSQEPRLILLAPDFSPRVRSAARQLSRPQISWVRFHYLDTPGRAGILFEPVPAE